MPFHYCGILVSEYWERFCRWKSLACLHLARWLEYICVASEAFKSLMSSMLQYCGTTLRFGYCTIWFSDTSARVLCGRSRAACALSEGKGHALLEG